MKKRKRCEKWPFWSIHMKHDGFGSFSGQHAIVYMWEGLQNGSEMRLAEVKLHSINKDFEILW